MKIQDNRFSSSEWFKSLPMGATFEYLGAFYMKTGVSQSEPNAVDLQTGSVDIIRLDADVTPVRAVLTIEENESEDF